MFIRTNQILTRILYFVAFVTFSYQNLQSQIPYVKPDGEKIELADFKGTPYLEKEFQKGVVYDGLTGKENNLFLRYDALNDTFEMKDTKATKNKEFLKKAYEVHVGINDKVFYYQNYINEGGRNVTGYLREITTVGDKKFYIKYGKNLVMPKKAATTLEQDRPGRIENESFYVVGVSNKLKATDIKKKNVLDHFPNDKRSELKQFIKKNRLRFKDEKDIKKLADYMKKIQ